MFRRESFCKHSQDSISGQAIGREVGAPAISTFNLLTSLMQPFVTTHLRQPVCPGDWQFTSTAPIGAPGIVSHIHQSGASLCTRPKHLPLPHSTATGRGVGEVFRRSVLDNLGKNPERSEYSSRNLVARDLLVFFCEEGRYVSLELPHTRDPGEVWS